MAPARCRQHPASAAHRDYKGNSSVLKGLVVFGLTRRPIILLCLLVFVGAGLFFLLDRLFRG